jgi:predicted NAD-dependent protein-ADP-ribosyltransferase YbiA (DUF1768 family)
MSCRDGKTLNPHTCVYVKDCKPGFIRNDKFQCRKDIDSPKAKSKTSKHATKHATEAKPNQNINATRRKLKEFGFVAKIPSDMSTNYDEDTVFVFHSKSSDAAPGKGSREKIPDEKREMYEELDKIPDWRKQLSNFWIKPFYKQGFVWASVEHYYQASKFKMEHEEFYKQFALDKGTRLSKDPALAKATGNDLKYRPEITIDRDFPKRAVKEMFRAQHAKFTQNAELKALLQATKKAKLMHYNSGKLETFDGLMYIRDHMLQ